MAIINLRIKQVRETLNLNQIDFSKRIGITQGFLSDIEREKSKPSVEALMGIAKHFNISAHWLLTGEGKMERKEGLSLDEIPRQTCTFVANLKEIPRDVKVEEYISIPLVDGRIAAGEPVISPGQIEGWAIIHVSQVGRKANMVAIRLDKKTGTSMEPLIRAGSMVAIDRDDTIPQERKIYAVRKDGGATIKFVQREGDILIMIPGNPDRKAHPIQTIDLKGLTYNPIIGRVIWNWQTL